jgi:HD-GYP domain-containing protein (c-di-GMP phosphodiesterase class II)
MFAEICDLFIVRDQVPPDTPLLAHWLLLVSRLTDLAEGRAPRHGLRVAMIALHLAQLAKLSADDTAVTVQAALLHDVGVLPLLPRLAHALPPALGEKSLLAGHRDWQHGLLDWPVTLTPEARMALHHHPRHAKAILQPWQLAPEVINTIAASHEQWDGNGYPDGLAGTAISLTAQVVAMADLLDGLMTANLTPLQREQHIRAVLNSPPIRAHCNPDMLTLVTVTMLEDAWWYRDIFNTEATVMGYLPQDVLHPSTLLAYSGQVSHWVEAMAPVGWQGHSQRVAALAQRVAAKLGVDAQQQGQLILAGLWHEMGKISLPVSVWVKPDPLTQQEWQRVKSHPQLGAELLASLPGCHTVASWIAEQHERMNGSGYPGGQKGVQIPVAARLLALCDVFDALTHPRPYRLHPYTVTEALSLMADQRNRLFDANLFAVFKDVVLQHTTVYSQLTPA